ncbi:MAG: flagellar brake protein [Agathobacter sp.]|uniref:flagellar brake protein n=1 Tax=Agathobacter sp. TaxID=2021311 RepID=UPI002588CD9D|nr:flagellar brake protein [Agathobacter sp.]MCR5676481.1 flagellar brake protein [Agathobacter sp.]
MDVQEILTLGDKIDIRLAAQPDSANDGIAARLYKSSLLDFISDSDTEMEIGMPTYNGKMVLFHVGLHIELVFYTSHGLYSCTAIVLDRYKRGNLYIIRVERKTPLKKFQRREFFRIDCYIEMSYYKITEEVANYPKTQMLYHEIMKDYYIAEERPGVAIDISGGGIRFVSDYPIPADSYILVKIQLSNDKVDQVFFLVTRIIESIQSATDKTKFQNRGNFMFKEMKDRESIVRYVFEEERRIRNGR